MKTIKKLTICCLLAASSWLAAEKPARTESEILFRAICKVESNNNPKAIGDRHLRGREAVGIAQIRPILVYETNRLIGYNKFILIDRYSISKSKEIFEIYLSKWGKEKTIEQKARIWNGGPKGDKKKATLKYWQKIQKGIEMKKKITCCLCANAVNKKLQFVKIRISEGDHFIDKQFVRLVSASAQKRKCSNCGKFVKSFWEFI